MSPDQIALVAILLFSTLLYITQWVSVEVTSLLTIVALLVTGVLEPGAALSGFSSSATVTVAAMFVLSAGIMRTGALNSVTRLLTRLAGNSPQRLILLLCITVPVASGFLNNTPLVVLLIPILLTMGTRMKVAPSRLLLPLAYLASLGGTITLIGTSTNILVDGIYRDLGGAGLRLFDFTAMGMVYAGFGALYIYFLGPWLLPDRAPLGSLASGREGVAYISEIRIGAGSSAVGKRVDKLFRHVAPPVLDEPAAVRHRRLHPPRRLNDAQEQAVHGVEVLELARDDIGYRANEAAAMVLEPGDILLVSGTPAEISDLLRSTRASLATVLDDDKRRPARAGDQPVIEAVVLPTSTVNGRYGNDLSLHHLYGVSILGVQHHGRRRFEGLRHLRLGAGDVLLLQGAREDLAACTEATGLLVLEGIEASIARGAQRGPALAIMLGVVLLASFTTIPIVTLALAGAVLMILSGALRPHEAFRSLDSTSLLLLAGTIPLGTAMASTGLAQIAVDGLLGLLGEGNPRLFLALFFLVTWLLTELLSNNAVAVLMTPLALALAQSTGINATALLMVVIFGASASFVLPQGYQTNAMVMGPGGYRFLDYLRFGLPLSLLCWLVATIFIPLFWPLTAP